MTIFSTEAELVALLDKINEMISACANGLLEFRSFHQELGYLYTYHALDGHESDREELMILERYRSRIAWIEEVLEAIEKVCSDEDAPTEAYIRAGRFGSAEALRRLQALVNNRSAGKTESGRSSAAKTNNSH